MRRYVAFVACALAASAAVSILACGTDPVGVDDCRKIEHARCENAPACNISLATPAHRDDTPELDVNACERFYDDACLHGFVASSDPGAVQVQACVDAINTGSCAVVKNPETTPACAFLLPPSAVDAAADVDAD